MAEWLSEKRKRKRERERNKRLQVELPLRGLLNKCIITCMMEVEIQPQPNLKMPHEQPQSESLAYLLTLSSK